MAAVGFVKRHKRASITVALAVAHRRAAAHRDRRERPSSSTLIGLGIVALVVRRIVRANERRQAAAGAAGQLPVPVS